MSAPIPRETFIALATPLVAAANDALLSELKGLVMWRERELRTARVATYAPGDEVEYLLRDGHTRRRGTVSHLNKFSLSLWRGAGRTEAVPIERVVRRLDKCALCGQTDGLDKMFVSYGRDERGRPAIVHRKCYAVAHDPITEAQRARLGMCVRCEKPITNNAYTKEPDGLYHWSCFEETRGGPVAVTPAEQARRAGLVVSPEEYERGEPS